MAYAYLDTKSEMRKHLGFALIFDRSVLYSTKMKEVIEKQKEGFIRHYNKMGKRQCM